MTIEGDAAIDILINLPMPIDVQVRASGRYIAHRPVNAVPNVVAAEPGTVSATRIGQGIASLA